MNDGTQQQPNKMILPFLARKVREKGIIYCFKAALRRVIYSPVDFLIITRFAFVVIPRLLWLCLCGKQAIVHLFTRAHTIGHLATDIDYLSRLCYEQSKSLVILLFRISFDYLTINRELLNVWAQYPHIQVIEIDYWADALLRRWNRKRGRGSPIETIVKEILAFMSQRFSNFLYISLGSPSYFPDYIRLINADIGPRIYIADQKTNQARGILKNMGIPDSSWFVCLHVRETGYKRDAIGSSHRSCNIERYFKAIKLIASYGGWTIRMGDPTMTKLPENLPNVIDYAHSRFKSDLLDIYLCSQCLFFLGTSSGLLFVSTIFGRPAVMTNNPHFAIGPITDRDLVIYKGIFSKREGRTLSLSDVMSSDISSFGGDGQFRALDLELHENTDQQIYDVTKEMLQRLLEGRTYSSEETALQRRFKGLFKPYHVCHDSKARAGSAYLQEKASLGIM